MDEQQSEQAKEEREYYSNGIEGDKTVALSPLDNALEELQSALESLDKNTTSLSQTLKLVLLPESNEKEAQKDGPTERDVTSPLIERINRLQSIANRVNRKLRDIENRAQV